jgi:hypothetical protein
VLDVRLSKRQSTCQLILANDNQQRHHFPATQSDLTLVVAASNLIVALHDLVLQGQADLAEAVRQHMEALPKVCTEREFISEMMVQATRLSDRAELASEFRNSESLAVIYGEPSGSRSVEGEQMCCCTPESLRQLRWLPVALQLRCIEPATAPMGTHAITAL